MSSRDSPTDHSYSTSYSSSGGTDMAIGPDEGGSNLSGGGAAEGYSHDPSRARGRARQPSKRR